MLAQITSSSITRYLAVVTASTLFIGATTVFGGQLLVEGILGADRTTTEIASTTPAPAQMTVAAFQELETLTPKDERAATALAVSVAAPGRPAQFTDSLVEGVAGLPGAPTPAAAEVQNAEKWRVTADSLNVRAAPSSDSARVASVRRNDLLEVRETQGKWVRVADGGGMEGWVFSDYLAATNSEMAMLSR